MTDPDDLDPDQVIAGQLAELIAALPPEQRQRPLRYLLLLAVGARVRGGQPPV